MAAIDRAPFIELRGPLIDVGIFRDTLLPSIAIHSGLSLIAYGAGRYTDTVETKDILWPSAQLINAWWASVGRRMVYGGLGFTQALSTLSRPERLLLGGVSIWGGRLLYRIASRGVRRGKDHPQYDAVKKEEGFWNKALLTHYLPEAAIQALITLPFTAPFYHQGAVMTGYHPYLQTFSVGLFFSGLFLETVADYQLDKYEESSKSVVEVNKEGAWSIVRHPNYLGDALVHFSFPILLFASDMLAPVELLGPLANYLFLRHLGGDKKTELHQESHYDGEKKTDFEQNRADVAVNSFWPDVKQYANKWVWITVGAGIAGAGVEQVLHLMGLE